MQNSFALFGSKRFLPLFVVQFLGSFNDNLFKNSLIILITYRLVQGEGQTQTMVTLSTALFILPFFLFSAHAGRMADAFDKSMLIYRLSQVQFCIMLLAVASFYSGSVWVMMGILFLLGMLAAYFSPLKYSLLPQHLHKDELLDGNALIEAGTFISILLGTVAGGLLILSPHGIERSSFILLALSFAAIVMAKKIPDAPPASKKRLRIGWNMAGETLHILRYLVRHRPVLRPVLGISWFWLVGATYLSLFPLFVRGQLCAGADVATLFFTLFSIGIGLGSLFCARLLKGAISGRVVPWGAAGISLFTLDLYFASGGLPACGTALLTWRDMLGSVAMLRIVVDVLLVAVAGGIYIVPLYTLMQARAAAAHRARVVAGNNILNALFMVIVAPATLAMFALGAGVREVFIVIALLNALAALLIYRVVRDNA